MEKFDQRDVYAGQVWMYCQFGRIYVPCSDVQRYPKWLIQTR